MKKIIAILFSIIIVLSFAACGASKTPTNEHKHSILPGSEYCDTCGEKVVICKSCNMVSSATDEECWFCHKAF